MLSANSATVESALKIPAGTATKRSTSGSRNWAFVAGVIGVFGFAMMAIKPSTAVLFVGLSVLLIGLFTEPVQLLVVGVALTAFAGFWSTIGVPVPLHRVLLLGAIGGAFVGLPLGTRRTFKVRWRMSHLLIGMTVLWVLYSASNVGTIRTSAGQSGIFDRLGLIPYLLFILAPVIVDTEAKRTTVLRWLVIIGAYFAVTAILEGIGLKRLTWPSYINDPKVGISFERARGPFVDASANGLALFFSTVAGVLLARRSRGFQRFAAIGVAGLCLVTTVLTLTRSVWIGVAVGCAAMFMSTRRLRRYLLPCSIVGLFVVFGMFQLVPGLRSSADERAGSQRSLWDRENLNNAAIAVVKDKPLTGVGWSNFVASAPQYLWQSPDYPLSGQGIDVHNFVLRMLSEIGLVGFVLWISTFLLAIFGSLARRGPPELADWRWGLLGMSAMWSVVAALTPGEFSYPTFVLWMWAGITASPYLRSKRLLTERSSALGRFEASPLVAKFTATRRSRATQLAAQPARPRPRPIPALTGIRFFAAFYVVGYHYRATFIEFVPAMKHLNGFLEGGFLSVDFFFVLSGFIIGWNYLDRLAYFDTRESVRFLWTRLARFYPLHLFILGVLAGLAAISLVFGNKIDKQVYGLGDFVQNLLLVNSWRSSPRLTWNYPAWSISAEWLAYLLFPFGAVAFRNRNPRHVAFVCFVMSMSFTAVRHMYNVPSDLVRLAATFPLGAAIAAVMAARANAAIKPAKRQSVLLSPVLVPVLALALFGIAGFVEAGVGALIARDCAVITCTALLIASLAGRASEDSATSKPDRFLSSKIVTYLGASSYAMYMVHAPVLVLFQRVTSRFRLVDASLVGRGLTLFGLMSAVFLAAHIGYRLIEEPSRRLITGKRSKKRKSSVSRSATPSGVKR